MEKMTDIMISQQKVMFRFNLYSFFMKIKVWVTWCGMHLTSSHCQACWLLILLFHSRDPNHFIV